MKKNKQMINIKELHPLTQKIIIELQYSPFCCIDELEECEQVTLYNDTDNFNLDTYVDNETLLPGILEMFKETSHIDVERLINNEEDDELYDFKTYNG